MERDSRLREGEDHRERQSSGKFWTGALSEPPVYQYVPEDLTSSDSWWGSGWVHFLPWTPPVAGVGTFSAPADLPEWAGEQDFYIFHGTVENVDYPGRDAVGAAGSYSFVVDSYSQRTGGVVTEGRGKTEQPLSTSEQYTVALVTWPVSMADPPGTIRTNLDFEPWWDFSQVPYILFWLRGDTGLVGVAPNAPVTSWGQVWARYLWVVDPNDPQVDFPAVGSPLLRSGPGQGAHPSVELLSSGTFELVTYQDNNNPVSPPWRFSDNGSIQVWGVIDPLSSDGRVFRLDDATMSGSTEEVNNHIDVSLASGVLVVEVSQQAATATASYVLPEIDGPVLLELLMDPGNLAVSVRWDGEVLTPVAPLDWGSIPLQLDAISRVFLGPLSCKVYEMVVQRTPVGGQSSLNLTALRSYFHYRYGIPA